MSRLEARQERLNPSEVTTVMLPERSLLDLPHTPVLWGAFDIGLLLENRKKLLSLRSPLLTSTQKQALNALSNENWNKVAPFLYGAAKWTPVRANIAQQLGIVDTPNVAATLYDDQFSDLVEQQMRDARGAIVVMGTSHAILYPTHHYLKKQQTDDMRVIEVVIDQHIDTVINPGMNAVTSANFYHFLEREECIIAPVIFGPDPGLIKSFQERGEHRKTGRAVIADITEGKGPINSFLSALFSQIKDRWDITHLTFSVDLDVVSIQDKVFSVRYTPLMQYLGLGCQELPKNLMPADIDAFYRLLYPNAKARYFLQRENIRAAQDPAFVRASSGPFTMFSTSPMAFHQIELGTDLGKGTGLRMDRALQIIDLVKQEAAALGITIGIPLQSGGVYKGSVVEMCGFEDNERRTSKAAIQFKDAIAT